MNYQFFFPSGFSSARCPVCGATTNLFCCSGCSAVSYCCAAHRSSHRPGHKTECDAVKRARNELEREEAYLRAKPSSSALPADVFNNGVGHFWSIPDTQPYMRARFALANALLKVYNSESAMEQAVDHFLDMLYLNRADNLGVRDIVPALMLRLGEEQQSYDFIKWWAVGTDNYNKSDMTRPYLDIHDADCFESVDQLCTTATSLSHLAILTLLKLRFWLELETYQIELKDRGLFGYPVDVDDVDTRRPLGEVVRHKLATMDMNDMPIVVNTLEKQYKTMVRAVTKRNPSFWDLLIEEEEPSPPELCSYGSKEEAQLAVVYCLRAWQDNEDAIDMVAADSSDSVAAYKSPPNVIANIRAALTNQSSPAPQLEKRRGGLLKVFPSIFSPSVQTLSPTLLFIPKSAGRIGAMFFVSENDRNKVLVYVDGACTDNGQPALNPKGGWAVVFGPRPADVASGQLESKGPFGDDTFVHTSNRAELRAAIGALRLCDWRKEGFTSLVIATDSTYVVDGATSWLRSWTARGWRTTKGAAAKNQDLWELLLGEVERWDSAGLRVEFWKIPRSQNQEADKAAKQAAQNGAPSVLEFRDIRLPSSGVTNAAAASQFRLSRVVTVCLEWKNIFSDIYASLDSQLSSKVRMDRASTPQAAFTLLDQADPPSVILVGDGGIARRDQKKLWEHIIDHVHAGATVVLAGCFGSMLNTGEFDRFFALAGLPWRRGGYHRTDVKIRLSAVPAAIAKKLPSAYSQKAQYIKNVDGADKWYSDTDLADSEAAVAFGQVGSGFIGYIGDVNGEKGSEAVVLAMCGLLD